MQKLHDLREGRKSRRGMLRYVGPMAPEGMLRDVVAPRYVAIWHSGPPVCFDIRAFGVPADGAGPRHAINLPAGLKGKVSLELPNPRVSQASSSPCDGALRSSPT